MSPTDVVTLPKQRVAASLSKKRRPTTEEIAARAYEIFLLRGASHGNDLEDWLKAERELGEAN
jgi:Protein of unknown function (DUF2934)